MTKPRPRVQPAPAEAAAPEVPELDTIQNRGHSMTYGKQPLADGASGRRARLRHPARGGVRH